MGISDIPASFGFPTLLRIFLPGFLASILYGVAGSLLYSSLIEQNLNSNVINLIAFPMSSLSLGEVIYWLLIVIILGIFILSLDFYIYQFYEGLRFWHKDLWFWKFNKTIENYEKLLNALEKKRQNIAKSEFTIEDREYQIKKLNEENGRILHKNRRLPEINEEISNYEKEIKDLKIGLFKYKNDISKILYKLAEYPYIKEINEQYPRQPTRLGNVVAEYETYSEIQYGMDMMVFWPILWLIIPKDAKDELEQKGAMADVFLYISFIFLTYIPIAGICLLTTFSNKSTKLILYGNNNEVPVLLMFIILFLLIVTVLFGFSYLFYNVSVILNNIYGRYVKSIFDIYRLDLAEKLDVSINIAPNEDEKWEWRKYREFLLRFYRDPTFTLPLSRNSRSRKPPD